MKAITRLAWRSLFQHWRYSAGALITVAMGFISMCLFRSYMDDVNAMYEEVFESRIMYGHVMIEKEGATREGRRDPWAYALTPGDQAFVDEFLASHSQLVEERVRTLMITGMISNGRTSSIFLGKGYDIEAGRRFRGKLWEWDALAGRPLYLADQPNPIQLGEILSSIMDCQTQAQITGKKETFAAVGGYSPVERPFHCSDPRVQLSVMTEKGQNNAIDFNVASIVNGIYQELDAKWVVTSLENAQRLFDTQSVSFYAVRLKERKEGANFISQFNQAAKAKRLPIHAMSWKDHRVGDLYVRTLGFLRIFENFVVSILMAVAGLSVFNTFLKIVKERTREIGTLRSLGFTQQEMVSLFGTEAFFLAMLGNLAGVAASLLLTWLTNKSAILYKAGLLSEPVPFRIAYVPSNYVLSFVFLAVIAVFAATFAARGTVKEKIADNLIHV